MTRFGGLLYTYENNHSTILYLVMVQFSSLMILPALFDLCKSLKQDIKRVKMTSMSRFLLPIAKMFIAIRSGAWKREKYTSLDVVFSLVQIKVGMSKSQVRRCVIIVYLLSFFITSGASKNWPKRSPILTKINWTKFRVSAVPRRAKCSHIFFLKNSTMPWNVYHANSLRRSTKIQMTDNDAANYLFPCAVIFYFRFRIDTQLFFFSVCQDQKRKPA